MSDRISDCVSSCTNRNSNTNRLILYIYQWNLLQHLYLDELRVPMHGLKRN